MTLPVEDAPTPVRAATASRPGAPTPAPSSPPVPPAAAWLGLLACLAPLFLVTVRGWASGVLFIAAMGASALIVRRNPALAPLDAQGWRGVRLMTVVFVAPILSVAFSALLRGDWEQSQFDSPSRFLLGVPVLAFMLRGRFDVARPLRWVLPAGMAAALAYHAFMGQPARWPTERMTTAFADPLVFGYTSLTFGLMSLVAIGPDDLRERRWGMVLIGALGMVLGAYLSLRSGTRTGWFAVPVVIGLWLYLYWGRGHPLRSVAVALSGMAVAVAAYLLLPIVHQRLLLGVEEFQQYSWHGVAPISSIGLRLTYWRIAADLFALHPIAGVGDTSHDAPAVASAFSYASADAVRAAFQSAFHNQLISNAVRSGVLGLLATAALLLAPLAVCARGLRATSADARRHALMGTTFCLCMVLSSMTTEIVDLKYMASFYTVMVAVLCGSVMARCGGQAIRRPPR